MSNKKLIKFPSIEQFRNVIANIKRQHEFAGLDETGEAIYDRVKPKPLLTFSSTIKVHGTNAGICLNHADGLWVQSRENIITPESDNAGFAFFVETNKEAFMSIFSQVVERSGIDLDNNTVSVFGEWAGGNIQKGVGISNLLKSFFIFGVKVSPHVKTEEELKANPAYWVDYTGLRNPDVKIYNIGDYQTRSIVIDFNQPELVQNQLIELTLAVEEECPVAKAFGFSGIGEGLVWSCEVGGVVHRFKVKGERHAASKVKTLASVDIEKLGSINEFVDYAVTESRFNQALENVFPNDQPIDVKRMGEVIKWVTNDIIKEESDTLSSNGLEPKDINKSVSTRVREMFFKLTV